MERRSALGIPREQAMTEGAAIIFEESVSVPVSALTLEGFRRWVHSPEFPESGRIDFLAGSVEVDMSPEDLFLHGEPKSAIASRLWFLVTDAGRGHVFADRTRFSSDEADLHVEPDVAVVLFDSVRSGRVRWLPSASGKPDSFVEIQGSLDLAVEVVSKSSVGKDTRRLPPLYAQAGVPELWLVDARGPEIDFQIRWLVEGAYQKQVLAAGGWAESRLLGGRFRLTRQRSPVDTWVYRLEHEAPAGAGGRPVP
jgi:Uma2 family endonuclease